MTTYGNPKQLRIRRRKEITRLFSKGRRAGDQRMLLIGLPGEPGSSAVRGCVVISKRHGNAVARNRIKRLCREAFRLTRPELPAGFDFVMAPRSGKRLDLTGLRESLRKLAPRIAGGDKSAKGKDS
ncbi:MAG: ribonuclease P protein component [Phycisphaerae bacterium]|nr:ribonuclease P protein component [Phycisphaerae bacterium]